jgi:hypothetical protein
MAQASPDKPREHIHRREYRTLTKLSDVPIKFLLLGNNHLLSWDLIAFFLLVVIQHSRPGYKYR